MTTDRSSSGRTTVAACCLALTLCLLSLAGGPARGFSDGPATTIEGAPRIETYREYHYFRFSSEVPGSNFFCALDNGPFAPCRSGAYRYVPYGQHTFSVYAVDPDGTRGATASAEYESRDPNWD